LEFPDDQIVLLTLLEEGQQATVLQLPATHESASSLLKNLRWPSRFRPLLLDFGLSEPVFRRAGRLRLRRR
jgi:hypothetical protein